MRTGVASAEGQLRRSTQRVLVAGAEESASRQLGEHDAGAEGSGGEVGDGDGVWKGERSWLSLVLD